MSYFIARFSGTTCISLLQTEFCSDYDKPARCIRGRESRLYDNCGTFAWSAGVRAVCLLMVRARIHLANGHMNQSLPPVISSCASSVAASLDYALSKSPVWLCEMFGSSPDGSPVARRIFIRSNPERKRPGPVVIGVNSRMLPFDKIQIWMGDKECVGLKDLHTVLQGLETLPTDSVQLAA